MSATASLPRLSLRGRSCIVTGAGSGIGAETAKLFAAAGASTIVLSGRDPAKLDTIIRELAAIAPESRPIAVPGDLTRDEVRRAVTAAIGEGSEPVVLVSNAGAFSDADLEQSDEATVQSMLRINLEAPLLLARALLPRLTPGSSIVHVSSSLAKQPIASAHAYSAAKAGLSQLTKSLALELAPRGVRVNAVLPGIVDTPMIRKRFGTDEEYESGLQEFAAIHPLGRIGAPRDVAWAILFLASDAASWITGVELPVDGGVLLV